MTNSSINQINQTSKQIQGLRQVRKCRKLGSHDPHNPLTAGQALQQLNTLINLLVFCRFGACAPLRLSTPVVAVLWPQRNRSAEGMNGQDRALMLEAALVSSRFLHCVPELVSALAHKAVSATCTPARSSRRGGWRRRRRTDRAYGRRASSCPIRPMSETCGAPWAQRAPITTTASINSRCTILRRRPPTTASTSSSNSSSNAWSLGISAA